MLVLRKELEDLAANSNGRFVLYVSISEAGFRSSDTFVSPFHSRSASFSSPADSQHCLNKPPANWTQGTGFITKDMIEQHQPVGGVGSSDHGVGPKVLMCGPPPMMSAMKGHLKELGYPAPRSVSKLEDQVFLF